MVLGNNYQWRSYLRLNEEYCSEGKVGRTDLDNDIEYYDDDYDDENENRGRRKRQIPGHNNRTENEINNIDDDDEDYYDDYYNNNDKKEDNKMNEEYYSGDGGTTPTDTTSLPNGPSNSRSIRKFTCDGANPKCLDRMYFATSFQAAGWAKRSQLLLEWRAIADRYSELNVTVFDEMGYYSDHFLSIGAMSLQTILIAMACMALICLIFIPHLSAAAFAMASILSINLGVFGFLSLWGVDLDPVSMALTLMSIGFSVDYTSHICYHFFRKPGNGGDSNLKKIHPVTSTNSDVVPNSNSEIAKDAEHDIALTNCSSGSYSSNGQHALDIPTSPGPIAMTADSDQKLEREDRLWSAFVGVGWPTIQAGISTLIGGLCMFYNPTYSYIVFIKTIILVIGFGLAHAMFIMPVVLSSLPVPRRQRDQ